jgi:translation initiation factor IF-3
VNERIRGPKVRVIDPEGQQLGVMPIAQARAEAEKWSLDLIEVAPEADPPVCRIMDYGKFRYEAQKKIKESSKKSSQTELKGIRVRPNTDDHDMAFKVKNAVRFLLQGNMVKFNVIFRGPELRHKEVGMAQLTQFIEATKEVAEVESAPRMEGRQMTMLLRPKPEAVKKAVKPAAAAKPAAPAEPVEGAEEPKRGPTPKHHEPVLIPEEME